MSSKYTPHTVVAANLIRSTALTHPHPGECQGCDSEWDLVELKDFPSVS